MIEPFGKQEGAGKRPAQTIEGTATEISAGPVPGAEKQGPSEPHPGETETPQLEGAGTGHDGETGPPRTTLSGLKSFMTHLAAGLLGGLIGVIGLAFAWDGFDFGNRAPSPELAALEQRVAKLEVAPAPSGDSEKLTALEARIATLEVNTGQMPSDLAAVESRVAQLESSLKTLAGTANEGGSVASAAAAAQQIAEAEQRLSEKIAAARQEGEAAKSALTDLQTEIGALKAKVGALAEAELGGGADVGPELNALSERIAKLETLLPDLATALSKETAGVKSAAIAIAFANLRAAVSDGRPYASELDTLGALAPGVGDLGVLPGYAEKGIPTVPELARSFAGASDNALAAAAPPPAGSFLDKMMASAQSLVKVRRVGEAPTGEGPSAALARAKAALDKGDLAGAAKEAETLDGAPREAFSAWLAAARARLGADEVLTRLEGLLLVTMSGQAETQQP
jgi:hypothetical protein